MWRPRDGRYSLVMASSESSEVEFAITVEPRGEGTTAVVLAGELDLYRLPAVTEALQSAASARRVVVDLREVTFLDSTTLGLLVHRAG